MEISLDFEKPILHLEHKLQDLRELAKQEGVDFGNEITILEKKVGLLIDETFSRLTPWQRVQLSRHSQRPHVRDYIDALFPDFMELHGDRAFGDDEAIVGGVAKWPPIFKESVSSQTTNSLQRSPEDQEKLESVASVLILGHQKGRNTKQKLARNFGMAKPEGYRKSIRLMQMASRFRMPILTFIDTPGAYPGMDAEERGQSQAIAQSLEVMFQLDVPILAVVVGEGGSGGALAIGIADTLLMQEYSTYSVISPESCASILWSDSSLAERASEKLKMNPSDLLKLGVIDGVISEPKGGAHRNWDQSFSLMHTSLMEKFHPDICGFFKFKKGGSGKRIATRISKYRVMGNLALDKTEAQSLQSE